MQSGIGIVTIEKCRTCGKLSLDCVQIEEASLLVFFWVRSAFPTREKEQQMFVLRVTGSDSSIDSNVLCHFPENDPKQNWTYF